jgi:hypothetical protein
LTPPIFRPKPFTHGITAGFPAETKGLAVAQASMMTARDFAFVQWRETSQPPQWQGFNSFFNSDFSVPGILRGGVDTAPLTECLLRS